MISGKEYALYSESFYEIYKVRERGKKPKVKK
jgi:hypothetical protein